MQAKDGSAGKIVKPAKPAESKLADEADPVKMAKIKKQQQEEGAGKYGEKKVEPHKPKKDDDEDEQKEKAWIEIELVGEDDKPIPGEKYRVTLPDGTVDEGTLDEKGWARIEGFDEGDCKITFPDLDKEAWEFLESKGPLEEEKGA